MLRSHFDRDYLADFYKIYETHPLEEFEKDGIVFGQMAVSLEELPNQESFKKSFCDVVAEQMKEFSPPSLDTENES